MIIYKTTNLINGKRYIGKDKYDNPKYIGSGKLLKYAINKYGKQNFIKETIEDNIDNVKLLNEREIYWIDRLKPEYNIAKGGYGGDTISNNPNKENINEKIRQSKLGKTWIILYGKREAKRKRKKLSLSLKGRISSNKGKTLAEIVGESRAKEIGDRISASKQGKYTGKGNPNYGNKWSEEQKKNLSEKLVLNKIGVGDKNSMYGKHFTTMWKEKYGEKVANRKIKKLYKKIGKSLIEANKDEKIRMSHAVCGEKNGMSGKSIYDVWIEKFGKEIADKKYNKMINKMKKNQKGGLEN
jgi:group I intron endonuclease